MDNVVHDISLGVGRTSKKRIDHDLFDDPAWKLKPIAELKKIANTEVSFRNPVLVGLAVCSHQADASTVAIFSDVSVKAEAPSAAKAQ